MKTYIYKVENHSHKRGYNRCITVYRIKQNKPIYLGCEHVSTASYYGDRATACQLISQHDNEPMIDSYTLKNSINMRIMEV